MKRRIPLIVGIVVILSGFGYLVYGGIGKNLVYFLTPTELLAKGPSAVDSPVRLGGMVKPGSVKWDPNALDLRFELTDGQSQILVHSTGAPPTMFRDTMGVVVEGKLSKSGIFESDNLMVKHSNQYRPPAPGQKPEEMYKTLIHEGQN